jgi:phosphonoacetate hydrolase
MASASRPEPVTANRVRHHWPARPVVVVCIDAGEPDYLQPLLADGAIRNMRRLMAQGFATVADATVPSFACANNMSIITGTPASKLGISGNHDLDVSTGQAVVMIGPELLCDDAILAKFADAGAKVVNIAAKDKLRRQLDKNLDVGRGKLGFPSEHADRRTLAENGIGGVLELVGQPLPDMHSMELSLFVLAAGIKRLEMAYRGLLFLSLADFVQHIYAPHEAQAKRFYQALDQRFGRLEARGAIVARTPCIVARTPCIGARRRPRSVGPGRAPAAHARRRVRAQGADHGQRAVERAISAEGRHRHIEALAVVRQRTERHEGRDMNPRSAAAKGARSPVRSTEHAQ